MTKRTLYALLFVALILLLGGLAGASLAQDQVTNLLRPSARIRGP